MKFFDDKILDYLPKPRILPWEEEGIKNEVDRQRRYGRTAVIIALLAGLIVGALAMSLAYLYPVNPSKINDSIISDIRMFMDIYKNYLLLPIAGCAISLSLILGRQKVFI